MSIHKNYKILITGSSGFIGKNLIKYLKQFDLDIIEIRSSDFNLSKEKDIINLFKKFKNISCIINLAADVGGISEIKKNHGRIIYNNVMINTLLLENARKNNVKKFINLNTINAYADSKFKLKESELWNGFPNNDIFSYGISKRLAIAQSLAYSIQFWFNTITLVVDNTYGPYDNFNPKDSRVIPALISKFYNAKINNEKVVEVWGSGRSVRQFLFVKDLIKIIYSLLDNNINTNLVLNISNGENISIKDLSYKISSILNFKGKIEFNSNKPEGSKLRIMDNSLMKKSIDFKSFTSIDNGLKETIMWYKKNN